jgi:hypothetical protein
MQTNPPTPEELAALEAEHAHRFPEKANVPVIGDGGVPVRLPFVLGLPTGSCKMPSGQKSTKAWSQAIGITLKMVPDSSDATDALASDCVLWPPKAVWATWCDRWPGLPVSVLGLARKKCGASIESIEEPELDEEAPAAVLAELAQRPRASWRKIKLRGKEFGIAIDPPAAAKWELFVEAIKGSTAKDHWAMVRDLATSCAVAVGAKTGEEMTFADLLQRWPGIAVIIVAVVGQLVGASSSAELGNF